MPMQVATKFVQSIYSNTFISNSNFLIPAFPILYVFHPPIEQFALPETSARSYEEKLPFLPSHESLSLSFSPHERSVCKFLADGR